MKLVKLIFIISIITTSVFADRGQVEGFVERFYVTVLDRDSEKAGLDYWSDNLMSGSEAGADIARGFIFSEEFTSRATTNEAFLYVLYRAFFNREPDSGGFNDWTNHLNSGKDRSFILDGFLYSDEFSNLCKEYGIEPTERIPQERHSYTRNSNDTVTDNITGLIWQDNEEATGDSNLKTWKASVDYCSNLDFAGSTNWRLPTIDELVYIADKSKSSPSIDSSFNYIYNAYNYYYSYWSSTPTNNAYLSEGAWVVSFYNGDDNTRWTSEYDIASIRCVTGEQVVSKSDRFTRDNIIQIVTDSQTNLQWQDDNAVTSENNKRTWGDALNYCKELTLGSRDDWRLPNFHELYSVADRSKFNPAIYDNSFLNTLSIGYWSSTKNIVNNDYAWVVDFTNGSDFSSTKAHSTSVRCVRGGL